MVFVWVVIFWIRFAAAWLNGDEINIAPSYSGIGFYYSI